MIHRTYFRLVLFAFSFLLVLSNSQGKTPHLMLRKSDVEDVRKAQIYLQKQLQMYDHQRADKYTLYLAVKNYANRLQNLELSALSKLGRQALNSSGKKNIEQVLLGSTNNIKGNGQPAFAKQTFLENDKSYLYFKKWKIDLNRMLQIQDNPQNVIIKQSPSGMQGKNNQKTNFK